MIGAATELEAPRGEIVTSLEVQFRAQPKFKIQLGPPYTSLS